MPEQTNSNTAPTSLSAWASEPYGSPTASSEVSRIAGFYTVAALTVFGPVAEPPGGREAALPIAA